MGIFRCFSLPKVQLFLYHLYNHLSGSRKAVLHCTFFLLHSGTLLMLESHFQPFGSWIVWQLVIKIVSATTLMFVWMVNMLSAGSYKRSSDSLSQLDYRQESVSLALFKYTDGRSVNAPSLAAGCLCPVMKHRKYGRCYSGSNLFWGESIDLTYTLICIFGNCCLYSSHKSSRSDILSVVLVPDCILPEPMANLTLPHN